MSENAFAARWRKLPIGLRYGTEAVLARAAVAGALALLAVRMLDAEGYLATLHASFAEVQLPIVDASFKITTYNISIDTALYALVLILVGGAAFSPWRAPSLVLSLCSSGVLAVAFPYTRLTANFLHSIPVVQGMLPAELQLGGREPPLLTVLLAAGAMMVAVVFAAAEGSRALRRAYEEKGVAHADLRSLGTLQVGAIGIVAVGAVVAALALGAFLSLVRTPLRDLPIPRLNPVLTFLIMGLFLGLAIVAFAWKPAPGEAPRTTLAALRASFKREKKTEE